MAADQTTPATNSKTTERMEQERRSPGSNTAGGISADEKVPKGFETPAGNPDTGSNTAARRGDIANAKPIDEA